MVSAETSDRYTKSSVNQLWRRVPWQRAAIDHQPASFVLSVGNATGGRVARFRRTCFRSRDHNAGAGHEAAVERLEADDGDAAGGRRRRWSPREGEETQVEVFILRQQEQEGQGGQEVGRKGRGRRDAELPELRLARNKTCRLCSVLLTWNCRLLVSSGGSWTLKVEDYKVSVGLCHLVEVGL